MSGAVVHGIIGITDEGRPVVTTDYQCPHFTEQSVWLTGIRECWYCKFSDFRKTCDIMLQQSICRCPQNRVTVMSESRQQLQLSAPLEKFISNIRGGVISCVFDRETQSSKAMYLNAGWTAITGYTLEDLTRELNGNPQALVYQEDKPTVDFEYNRQLESGNEYTLLYRVIRRGGATIWVIDRGVSTVLPNGNVQNQSIVTEVTELKEQEERLQRLVQLDLLTDLYNKVAFTQQARMVLARQCDRIHALIMVDIDNFKKINDSIGHACGDKVLELIADCFRALFRNRDVLGRIGGDEFMVLMTDISGKAIVEQKAHELCTAVSSLPLGAEMPMPITVSLGIALFTEKTDYEELFRQADAALYQAKSSGKNQAAFFHEGNEPQARAGV